MKEQPLISVIVPVYKVEKYLDRCIQSVTDQTYENLEILLVDDGSPDRCGAICDAWAEKDSRIRVIHKENGGLSDARNTGMAAASGERMTFVDSDDWIEADMLERLTRCMDADDSDISACGIQLDFEDGSPSQMLTQPGIYRMNTEEALLALIREDSFKQPVCSKLYKSQLVGSLPFPVGKCHEDTFWSYQAVARAKRISVFDTPCYHYLQRGSSIMGAGFSLKRLDGLEAKKQMCLFLRENYPELEYSAAVQLLFSCVFAMQGSLRFLSGADLETARGVITAAAAEIKPLAISRELSFKKNALVILAQISVAGTARVLNLLTDAGLLS